MAAALAFAVAVMQPAPPPLSVASSVSSVPVKVPKPGKPLSNALVLLQSPELSLTPETCPSYDLSRRSISPGVMATPEILGIW